MDAPPAAQLVYELRAVLYAQKESLDRLSAALEREAEEAERWRLESARAHQDAQHRLDLMERRLAAMEPAVASFVELRGRGQGVLAVVSAAAAAGGVATVGFWRTISDYLMGGK